MKELQKLVTTIAQWLQRIDLFFSIFSLFFCACSMTAGRDSHNVTLRKKRANAEQNRRLSFLNIYTSRKTIRVDSELYVCSKCWPVGQE